MRLISAGMAREAFYSYSPASNGRLLLMGGFVVAAPGLQSPGPFEKVLFFYCAATEPGNPKTFGHLSPEPFLDLLAVKVGDSGQICARSVAPPLQNLSKGCRS